MRHWVDMKIAELEKMFEHMEQKQPPTFISRLLKKLRKR